MKRTLTLRRQPLTNITWHAVSSFEWVGQHINPAIHEEYTITAQKHWHVPYKEWIAYEVKHGGGMTFSPCHESLEAAALAIQQYILETVEKYYPHLRPEKSRRHITIRNNTSGQE